jgi:hypothetical protein
MKMSAHTGLVTRAVVAGMVAVASLTRSAMAEPNFAPNPNIGWRAYSAIFMPPASGPGPVQQDPAHPYITNDEFRVTGKQPTQRVGDLSSPILQPWAREVIRKRNELVLAGNLVPSPHASCWPVGVTLFLLSSMTQPMYIVQGRQEVALILTAGNDVRHIHMTDKHSANLKSSWYGDSVGHYEGDALLVDTIGLNDRTPMDGFGTPHTTKLHVTERFHLIDDGKALEANVRIEDPGAFTTPWNAIQRFRPYDEAARKVPVERLIQLATGTIEGPLPEEICAENPHSFFEGVPSLPIPQAAVPDF